MRGPRGTACVVLIGVAIPGQASALAITSATCSQQAGNSLRFDCSVAVDGAAEVWVAFCEDNGGACAYDRFTPHTVLGAAGTATVTMFGMAAAEDYDWRAVAKQGSTRAYGARTDVATGSLPAEMADITFTTWGTPDGVHNVVFNYACEQTAGDEHDWIVIADATGRVLWYENPEDVLGTKYPIAALNIARPEKHILVVAGRTYILEYALNGDLVRLYCRDDSSTAGLQCDDPAVSPDAYFTDFVHHDVSKNGATIWALTAEQQMVSDSDDCDPYASEYPIIVDGVYAFDTTTDSIVEEWDLSEVYSPSYADATCTTCTNGYWQLWIDGCDWAHTNSLWVDAALQWTLSSKLWSRIMSVDGDPASGSYRSLDWELEGDGVGGDFTLFSSGSYTATFSNQHAAMWTFDDTTFLFDNHLSTGGPDSRGVTIDWSTGDADIVAEYLMEDSTGSHLDCQMGGTFIDVLSSDTMFGFCPSHLRNFDPFFNEFTAVNDVVWGMRAACPQNVRQNLSSYRAYPILW